MLVIGLLGVLLALALPMWKSHRDRALQRQAAPQQHQDRHRGNQRADQQGGGQLGRHHLPALGLRGGRDLQRGVASWYGPGFHGRLTANGERFDMNELTAAHKTLPFGTRVLVHNPRTGKEVVVRINDRGPFIKGRMIDLSKAAAKALGFKSRGHDAVVLREVLPARANGELVASGRDS